MNNILNYLRGSFVPTRLHTYLTEDYDDYPNHENPSPNPEAERTIVHELFHYFQTLFTGFGQSAWLVHRVLTGFIVSEWIKATNTYKEKRPLPLSYLSSKSKEDRAKSFLIYKTAVETSYLFTACHSLSDPSLKLIDLPLLLNSHSWQINPIINLNGESIFLQGKDIIESHAHYLESVYSFVVNGIPFIESYDEKVLPAKYHLPFKWFITEIGVERSIEFPIICDLALQINFDIKIDSEDNWQKFNPSWRFVRLTNALKSCKELKIINSLSDAINNYDEYCSKLLKKCNYDSLEEIIQKRQNYLRTSSEQSNIEKIMDKALEFRKKYLWCGANPFLDISVWIEMKNQFPTLLIQTQDGLRVTLLENLKLINEFMIELQIQALASQVIGDFRKDENQAETFKCGFAYFNIQNGCHFQKDSCCSGILRPDEDAPFPIKINDEDEFSGCFFEAALMLLGTSISNLDIQYGHRIPRIEDLEKGF